MSHKSRPAPVRGRAGIVLLQVILLIAVYLNVPHKQIAFSVRGALTVDARAGPQRFVRYRSDPDPDGQTPGIWRGSGGSRAQVSPYALTGVEVLPDGYAVAVVLPQTGGRRTFTGDPDQIASDLHRAGTGLGCDAARRDVFWAVQTFLAHVQRWARVEGAGL